MVNPPINAPPSDLIIGGANINMCLHQVHFRLYNLMLNLSFNAPSSDQIIGGAWWSKYQHIIPPSLVEQISTHYFTKLYNLMVNPPFNAPPSD